MNIFEKLFEHNLWANQEIIQACASLDDDQLDALPQTATKGNIRATVWHLVESQEGYLAQLVGRDPNPERGSPPDFGTLELSARNSGDGLLALARSPDSPSLKTSYERDGYSIEPWVVMLQAINHATEHREQIKSMLSSLGVPPPRIDGWEFGRVSNALIKLSR